jgi:hypothetical protein
VTAPRELTELTRVTDLYGLEPSLVAYDRDSLSERDRTYWDERIIDLGGAVAEELLDDGYVVSWYVAPKSKVNAHVRISAGKAYENMYEERREATRILSKELQQLGLRVDLELIERVPKRVGLGPIEWTTIFIGEAVASALIGHLTEDLYARAKETLRRRRRGGKTRNKLGFRIYGPQNEVLKEWTTEEDDETRPADED